MTDIFNFLTDNSAVEETAETVARLAQRHRLLIEPFQPQIAGARVLDLGCQDGRWAYALATAGAEEVVGIDARQANIDQFQYVPEGAEKMRIQLVCNDIFSELETRIAAGEQFEVIALYGVFNHLMDHFRLLSLARQLLPDVIIIDSEFLNVDNAIIQLLQEKTTGPADAVAATPGHRDTVVGVPSRRGLEVMARALDHDVTWIDHALILGDRRDGMQDYFREGRKSRAVCALTPC